MPNLDNPTPEDIAEVREILLRIGYSVETMSDSEAVDMMARHLEESIPAPARRAGSPPVNARVWLHEALTSGGFQAPEDKHQLADVGDGGPPMDLGIFGIIAMRHTSGSDKADFSDERLAAELGAPIEELERAQAVLDEVAAQVGRPATPYPQWWKK